MERVSQTEKLYALLADERYHSTVEIMEVVYGGSHTGLARVGARIWDLKQGKWSRKKRLQIEGQHDKENPTIYWYRLVIHF